MNMEFRPGFDDVFVAAKERESLKDKIIELDKAINNLEIMETVIGYSENIQNLMDELNEIRNGYIRESERILDIINKNPEN